MTTYLVTRHAGAVQWMDAMGHRYDQHISHLEKYDKLIAGDIIVGSLPINIVADINQLGVKYKHLTLIIPQSLRGVNLTSEQLMKLDAKLESFQVTRLDQSSDEPCVI